MKTKLSAAISAANQNNSQNAGVDINDQFEVAAQNDYFDFEEDSRYFSGMLVTPIVAAATSGITSFLSDSDLGLKDIGAAATAAAAGLAAGWATDKYLSERPIMHASVSAATGVGLGVTSSKLTNKFFAGNSEEEGASIEVPGVTHVPA